MKSENEKQLVARCFWQIDTIGLWSFSWSSPVVIFGAAERGKKIVKYHREFSSPFPANPPVESLNPPSHCEAGAAMN